MEIDYELARFILDGTKKANILTAENANSLLYCVSTSEGKIVIVDVFKERLDDITFYLTNTISEVKNDI